MTVFYLDTSVALRALLGHSPSAALRIDETHDSGMRSAARLLGYSILDPVLEN